MATFFISTSYQDSSIVNYYKKLGRELNNNGHKVVMIYDGCVSVNEEFSDTLKEYSWPSRRPTKFKDFIFLYNLIKRHNPTYLLANFGSVNVMMLVGWLMRIKHRIAWYHTLSEQIAIDSNKSGMTQMITKYRKKIVYSLCTGILPVSIYAKNDCINYYGISESKLHVLYNLLPVVNMNKTIEKEKNKLVCVGRLHKSKGQEILIRAIAILVNKFPDIKVVFLGDGGEKEAYIELAEELKVSKNCDFLGNKDREYVLDCMKKANICIVPSLVDNLPTVSLEAQSMGTPVIVSNTGGMPETMKNGVTGFAIEPGNPELLSDKIELILVNENIEKDFSENAKQFFNERFSYKRMLSYVKYFEDIK